MIRKEISGAFALALTFYLSLASCGKRCDSTTSVPDASVNSTTSPSAPSAPDASSTPAATAWVVVETLEGVEGRWGAPPDTKGAWALIQRGKSPYPWRVTFAVSEEDPEYDCGVYEQLQGDWRVAYCKGGSLKGPRRALRLTIHVKSDSPKQLRIRLSNIEIQLILGRQ